MSPDRTRRNAYLAWLVVCLVWGTTYLAILIALETIPPALVGGIRYAIAGGVLALVLMMRGEPLPGRAQWRGHALVGFLTICMGNGGVIWAEQWVPSGIAAVVIASSPFWMTGIDALFPGGGRFTSRIVAGLLIGFSGILLLVWPDLTAGSGSGRQFAVGLVALQLACIGWAIGTAYGKRRPHDENALGAAAMQMLFGGLIMLVIATVRGEWTDLSFSPRTFVAEAYLTFVGSLAAYSAYLYALKHLPVSTVALYAYVNPVIAVLLGWAIASEALGPRVAIAAGLVLIGVAVARPGPGPQGPRLRAVSRNGGEAAASPVKRLFAR
jgi:drug/metabolite transporter (DMT)-like permease